MVYKFFDKKSASLADKSVFGGADILRVRMMRKLSRFKNDYPCLWETL